MKKNYHCGSSEHFLARRNFLRNTCVAGGSMLLGGGLSGLANAGELAGGNRQLLVIFLDGGLSQLESWDPKPGTQEGGPFRAIPTSVPGTHISELLPYTAQQMHHLAVIRSLQTTENDHTPAKYLLETGRNQKEGSDFPYLGAAASSLLEPSESDLPPYVVIQTSSYHLGHGGFLGSRYAGVNLVRGKPPRNLTPPEGLAVEEMQRRTELRNMLDQRLTRSRRTADTEAYASSYQMAQRMSRKKDVFDLSKESKQDQERYGNHDFGRHCLLARRLLEAGLPCIQVRHRAYDSHFENFNIHLETLGEFDRTFATLMDDLHQRGLLDTTMVAVMSEMGRTPKINNQMGRDHWTKAWSMVLGGCGIQSEAIHGKTDDRGMDIVDGKVTQGDVFHTIYSALGIDSTQSFQIGGKDVPIAEPVHEPIEDLLA